MGCGQNKQIIQITDNNSKNHLKLFEEYSELDINTYSVYYYQLLWKTRPTTCIYQLKVQDTLNKKEVNNLYLLLKHKLLRKYNNLESYSNNRLIIYYIHCCNGVIISRNSSKINYYLSNYIDNIIDICLVDISNVALTEPEKFNMHEVKSQSKFYFNLNNKEIDFSKINELISIGKQPQIFKEEVINEDEEFEEKKNILKKYEIIVKYDRKKYEKKKNEEFDEKESFFQNNKINSKEKKDNQDSPRKRARERKDILESPRRKLSIKKRRNGIISTRSSIKIRNSIKFRNLENEKTASILNNNLQETNTRDLLSISGSYNKTIKKLPIINLKKTKINNKIIIKNKCINKIFAFKDKNVSQGKEKEKEITPKKLTHIKFLENSPTQKDEKTELNEGNSSINNNNNLDIKAINNELNALSNQLKRETTFRKKERTNTLKTLDRVNTFKKLTNKSITKQIKNNYQELFICPYEIRDKCLIIKENRFTPEINRELEQLFFEKTYGDESSKSNNYSPYDHIEYIYIPERKRIYRRSRIMIQSIKSVNLINAEYLSNIDKNNDGNSKVKDYIIIHNRFKVPFELRESNNRINKILFLVSEFGSDSQYYLKEFIDMLSNYKNLIQININKSPNLSSGFVGWKFFKKLFSENFNIRWVSLKDSLLEDRENGIIISSMILKRIRYLNISNNNISNKAMYYLSKFLIKNQTLSILYMSKNRNITTEGIKPITKALQMHPNIIKLDVSHMDLKGSGQFFADLIAENKCLQELYLRDTNLIKSDICSLAEKLTNEDSPIIKLDIGLNCNIGDNGLKEIGKIINNNRSLRSIGLDGLNLSMNNYLPIFEAISKNRNIESYSLNMNWKLPLKGILNFFLKNPHVKEISITPWDIEKEQDKKFTKGQLYALEKFHLKAPNVIIKGINFVEYEGNGNDIFEELNGIK